MALTPYEQNFGPRWRVTSVRTGVTDIEVDDGLTFEGTGAGDPDSKLRNHTKLTNWGVSCKDTSTSTTYTVELHHTSGRHEITLTPRSGMTPGKMECKGPLPTAQVQWTATEGG